MDFVYAPVNFNGRRDKPPSEVPIEKRNIEEVPQSVKKHEIFIKFRQIIGANLQAVATTPKSFKLLLARMMSLYKDIIVLPHDENDEEIVASVDIPMEEYEFKKYATNIYVSASGHLHMLFKIRAETPLWQIKRNDKIQKYLFSNKVFLEQQRIASTSVVKIGGLMFTHNQLTHRDTLTKLIEEYCKEDDSSDFEIQLAPYTYHLKNQKVKIFTRLLSIECDKNAAKDVKKKIMHMFSPETDTGDEVINKMRFFPFQANESFTEPLLRQLINKQNEFLNTTKHIILYNMTDAY